MITREIVASPFGRYVISIATVGSWQDCIRTSCVWMIPGTWVD